MSGSRKRNTLFTYLSKTQKRRRVIEALQQSNSNSKENTASQSLTHTDEFTNNDSLDLVDHLGLHANIENDSSNNFQLHHTDPANVLNDINSQDTSQRENIIPSESLSDKLRCWAIKFNITSVAISELLKILKEMEVCKDLPDDSRSLMKTPRNVAQEIKNVLISPSTSESPPSNSNIAVNTTIIEEMMKAYTSKIESKIKEMIDTSFTQVKLEVQGIKEILLKKNELLSIEPDEWNPPFPLSAIEEIIAFEDKITKDPKTKESFNRFLRIKGGGDSPRKETNRLLKQIFEDEVASQCSWLGQKQNEKIGHLVFVNLITDYIVHRWTIKARDVELFISDWLRYAGQRTKRQMHLHI